MRHPILVYILLLTLIQSDRAGASVLGLSPAPPPIWHPSNDLPRNEIFERLDALEDRLYAQGFETTQELLELAVLNLSTKRPEDRERALDLLTRARTRDPQRLEVVLWHLKALLRAGDATTAERLMRDVADEFDGQVAYHYARGYAHWVQATRHLDPLALREAAQEFGRACELQPEARLYAHALRAVALARDEPAAALQYLSPLPIGEQVPLSMLLLRAGILSYDRATQEEAENLFGQALSALPDDWAMVWITGGGRLPGVAAGDVMEAREYWRTIDPDPTVSSNAHRLEFWRRFLVADLLWGDPTTNTPGWTTQPGDIWIRWGRPTVMVEATPDIDPFVGIRGPGPKDANGWGGMAGNMRRWTWSFAEGPNSFSLTFLDTNYQYRWHLSGEEQLKTLEARVRDQPVRFATPAIEAGFDLAVDVAMFLPSTERSRLITSVAVLGPEFTPIEDLGDVELEWALFDERNRRIDRGHFVLDPSRDRDSILDLVERDRRSRDSAPARVAQFGLDVRPGRYRLAVEAIDPISGGRRWTDSRVDVPPRHPERPMLSDLMLCSSFEDFHPSSTVPREFVRYARVTVPTPERIFPIDQNVVFVYFEAYDLGIEADGRTRTTVEYSIVPVTENVSSATSRFVEERTGVSPEGVVVKGTAIDLKELAVGRYEMTVTVVDQVTGTTMERAVEFELRETVH